MQKVKKFKAGKYNARLTENFRELISKEIGTLDTATSFMYLYRRFGTPTYNNTDDYKILYDYRFEHEDLRITVHASYNEFVYFSLMVPQKRFQPWVDDRKLFLRKLYKKNPNIPFMPFASLPFGGTAGFAPEENKKNWEVIETAAKEYFSKNDFADIISSLGSHDNASKAFEMLRPFEKKMRDDFHSNLTAEEREKLNKPFPEINDIAALEVQCMLIIAELLKGCYVRDVAINIRGYESEENVIKEYVIGN